MSVKIKPENYPEIIKVYNTEGKKAAYDMLCIKYRIKYPIHAIKRMKNTVDLKYDPHTDRFGAGFTKEDGIFMNLEELCSMGASKPETIVREQSEETKKQVMKDLVQSLISDRLMELSKYVVLDPLSRTIIVDKTAMQTDGYNVRIG